MNESLRMDIDNWFTYHSPTPEQLPKYQHLRDEAKALAHTINLLVPECPDKSAAIRKLRECIMTANAAIACNS